MAFRALPISDVEPISAVDGTLLWHPLRHALGVTGFGVNAYTAPVAGDDVVEEHKEGGPEGGHEELYVVVSGHARFTIDGEAVDAPAGTCVFLPDPESRRHAVAVADATTVLAVGGEPEKPFEVSAWEWSFRARPHVDAGGSGSRRSRSSSTAWRPTQGTARCSTTSPAARRDSAASKRPARTSARRSRTSRACASGPRRTRTSIRCASARTSRSDAAAPPSRGALSRVRPSGSARPATE